MQRLMHFRDLEDIHTRAVAVKQRHQNGIFDVLIASRDVSLDWNDSSTLGRLLER